MVGLLQTFCGFVDPADSGGFLLGCQYHDSTGAARLPECVFVSRAW